jgi:hypothetical protein
LMDERQYKVVLLGEGIFLFKESDLFFFNCGFLCFSMKMNKNN